MKGVFHDHHKRKKKIKDVVSNCVESRELTFYFICGSEIYLIESSELALRDLVQKKYSFEYEYIYFS